MIKKIEAEAKAERERTGRSPMGAEAIRRQSPFSSPATPRKASPAPLFHAQGEDFIRLRHAYRVFKAAFRQAAEILKAGDTKAPFPVGSFPPGLPFVRERPPPVAAFA